MTTAARIAGLLGRHPLIDGHNDLPWATRALGGYDLGTTDLAAGEPKLHTDLPRLAAGRVGAQFWSLWVPTDTDGGTAVRHTLEQIDFVRRLVARYPERLGLG